MHATITIQRLPSRYATYLIGPSARWIFAAIEGVSDVCVEHEDINHVTLSYDWVDPGTHFEGIDQMLKAQGMRRVDANDRRAPTSPTIYSPRSSEWRPDRRGKH